MRTLGENLILNFLLNRTPGIVVAVVVVVVAVGVAVVDVVVVVVAAKEY